jgi:glycosyltransferase involved in cell wall biosynthesis
VTTPLGGVREILEPAWGLLALPDPAAIAAAIQRLLLDPGLRRRLGELGPARARALCDPQSQIHAIARSMEPLFKKKAA